jgi:hypothetical protein
MRAFILSFIVAVFPLVTLAAPFPIVPCDGPDCGTCELISLGNNIIQFLIWAGIFIAIAVFMYAGFLLVTSGGNQSALEKAKGMAFDVLIGFVILLTGWLIVNVFMTGLTGQGLDQWTLGCTYATPLR